MSQPSHDVRFSDRGKEFTDSLGCVNGRELSMDQAYRASLERLSGRLGLKNLAEYFDGRNGDSVAKSTVSQWISGSRKFPADYIFILSELDSIFKSILLRLLLLGSYSPSEMIASVTAEDPKAGKACAKAWEDEIRRIAYGPGGMGEHY